MSITEKLLKAKKEFPEIEKDQKNPHYGQKYSSVNKVLETIEPILNEKGLLLTQPIHNNTVFTIIRDSEDENAYLESSLEIPDLIKPQDIGSCITYFRRYTLMSLLALQTEIDDDGNKASGKDKKEQKPAAKSAGYNEDDDRPWLDQKTKDAMLKAIQEGKGADVKERMNKYRMKKDYRNEINNELKAQNL